MLVCPECDNPIPIDMDEAEQGDKLQCDECGLHLEISSVDPLALEPLDDEAYDDESDSPVMDEDDE